MKTFSKIAFSMLAKLILAVLSAALAAAAIARLLGFPSLYHLGMALMLVGILAFLFGAFSFSGGGGFAGGREGLRSVVNVQNTQLMYQEALNKRQQLLEEINRHYGVAILAILAGAILIGVGTYLQIRFPQAIGDYGIY